MSSSQPTDAPPFSGVVETTMNALRLIHAAREGVIPRITRRLNDSERRSMIKSGAVFVFSVEESTIKRWTDGLQWSPSRIVGNFLVYREIINRANSRGSHKKLYPADEPSRPMTAEHGTFKPNGLIKKTITVTIEGSDLHLISYYTSSDQHSGKLKRPASRPDIMSLPMDPRLFRDTNFRVPPKVEKGIDGTSRLIETEEVTDVVECKVEEEPYSVSVSPTSWGSDGSSQSSPVETTFGNTGALCVGVPSPPSYPRHSDRWQFPVSPTLRPDTWSSHSSHHYSPRRDTNHSESWGSLSSARWSGETYHQSPSPPSSVFVDRPRNRSTPYPSPLQISSPRRDAETLSSRYAGGTVGDARGESSARSMPWLHTGGDPDTKDNIRVQHTASPFTSTNAQPVYNAQGYIRPMASSHTHSHSHSYSSGGWSSGSSAGSLALASPQAPFSPAASGLHSPYGSSYAPSSGGMPSPEEYSNADEYADS